MGRLMKTVNVLFVDDEKYLLQATERLLANEHYNKFFAQSAVEALKILETKSIHILVSDMKMPGIDGLDLLMTVKEKFPDTIRMVFSAYTQTSQILPCINQGEIFRFITKPLNPKELIASIQNAIELLLLKKERFELTEQLQIKNKILEQTLTEKQLIEEHLKNLSILDELTGIYNRRQFTTSLHREFNHSQRYQTDFSLLMLDLDHFKTVNDTFGHAFGDFVLKIFARRVRAAIRETDLIFRYGGEEFMVLLPNTAIDDAVQLGGRILRISRLKPFIMDRFIHTCTVSIGAVSHATIIPTAPEDLIEAVDQLLYKAKQSGRDQLAATIPLPSALVSTTS